MNFELRDPNIIMKLSRLGSFHQSRLSFLRSFLNELKDWNYKRDLFDLDKNGHGTAIYSFSKNKRNYSLVCLAQHIDENERSDLMVRNPWWSEGGANYLSELLYSQQPGVSTNYLKDRMRWKMNVKSDFLAYGKRLEDLQYGEQNNATRFAYDLGTWFIAYLIYHVGLDVYKVNFYDDLNEYLSLIHI